MDETASTYLIDGLRQKIREHNLKSGEVILEYKHHHDHAFDIEHTLADFFSQTGIVTEQHNYSVSEISKHQAHEAVLYGFSTKPNYTAIEREFTTGDINEIWFGFLSLFTNPRFYSVDCRLYQSTLDLNDFWETGGAIVRDKQFVGILWVNDLYDKFSQW